MDEWREHLRVVLHDYDEQITDVPSDLFECLDQLIGEHREHATPPKQSMEKKELASILKKVKRLRTSIDNVSYETHAFLDDLYGDLCQAEEVIETAIDTYPGRGGQYDYRRLDLARQVARLIQEHLGISPTVTKGGIYERILSVILQAVTGKEPQSLNDLARRALNTHPIRLAPKKPV